MALILNIDTSSEIASICLSKEENVLQLSLNNDQKDHASWLHGSIEKLFDESGFEMKELQAIAVTIGPGSYTGLRVGLAAAKGLCYALSIPLITENTLRIMASSVLDQITSLSQPVICPMIDARRMEVFTAIYSPDLLELMAPESIILNENSFEDFLRKYSVLYTGSGIIKWKQLCYSSNAFFVQLPPLAAYLAVSAYKKFTDRSFADLMYTEPFYLKGFYTHEKK